MKRQSIFSRLHDLEFAVLRLLLREEQAGRITWAEFRETEAELYDWFSDLYAVCRQS